MTRTMVQKMSDGHELWIKELIQGSLTKGSGNQWHAQLDAKNGTRDVPFPIGAEAKATLGKSLSITRDLWRKLREQCFGEIPTWWGRFYRDETLRTSDLDLVALEADDFIPILKSARKWSEIEEEVGHEGVLESDYVISIMRDGKKWRDQQKELLLDEVLSAYSIDRDQISLVGSRSHGCDCCR